MKSALSNEVIDEIRKKIDIVEVISNYIPLTPRGKNFFGVCPFHADHSPSMSVSKEKQIYTCFSCGASGNVYNFLMDYENISFIDAVKKCADKVGISLNISENNNNEKNKELYEIYRLAQKFYQNNINTEYGIKAKKYLNDRKIDENLIKTFEIGLSLNKKDELTNLLINKNYNIKLLEQTGLINKSSNGYYDNYVNRIMFPLYDLSGKIVGYSGRIYNGEDTNKYLNTKETKIFKKGELLYNYHRAKESVRITKKLIIVEGFMDVIRFYSVGIENVIATMGTAITKEQALQMKKLSTDIILCFDGDDAGAKATNSCVNELEKIGVLPKVVRLENNLDPDEYIIKYGKNKIIEKLENPINSMDFKMNYLKKNKNLNNNKDMTDYITQTLDEIKKIDNDTYKELSVKKLSDETGLSIEYLKSKIKNNNVINIQTEENVKLDGYTLAERNLLYYMMDSKDVIELCLKEKPLFKDNLNKALAKELILYYNTHRDISVADVLTHFKDSEYIDLINKLVNLNLGDLNMKIVKGYISRLNDRKKKLNLKKLNDELISDISKEEKLNKLKEIIEMKKEDGFND